jgi:hypothetical protein
MNLTLVAFMRMKQRNQPCCITLCFIEQTRLAVASRLHFQTRQHC